MDDNSFDDLIKKKLSGYEDPVFEPSSLVAMRDRLAGMRTPRWYAIRTSPLLVISAALLLTIINGYMFWGSVGEESAAPPPLAFDARQARIVDSLNQVIAGMNCRLTQVSEIPAPIVVYMAKVPVFEATNGANGSIDEVGFRMTVRDIPADVREWLVRLGYLTVQDGQGYIAFHRQNELHRNPDESLRVVTLEIPSPVPPRFILINSEVVRDPGPAAKNKSTGVSLATQKALEKHYYKGVGIEVAPHLDVVKGIFANGVGEITPRIGITADWIMSPRLSVETGFDYLTTVVHLGQSGKDLLEHHDNPQFGSPESVSSLSTLMSMPIALKYRQWINSRNQALIKLGVSPYASLKHENQFTYQYQDNYGPDHDLVHVTTLDRHDDFKYYGTTLTAALGIVTVRPKNKGKIETSFFYERSMGQMSYARQVMQLAGLRVAYWFRIK